jgi:hypothetical protein
MAWTGEWDSGYSDEGNGPRVQPTTIADAWPLGIS